MTEKAVAEAVRRLDRLAGEAWDKQREAYEWRDSKKARYWEARAVALDDAVRIVRQCQR